MNRTQEDLKSQQRESDRKITSLQQEIDRLTQELQLKSLQLTDVKKSANEINGSKCVQLACAQEEIAHLKNEMANILNGQNAINREVSKNNRFIMLVYRVEEEITNGDLYITITSWVFLWFSYSRRVKYTIHSLSKIVFMLWEHLPRFTIVVFDTRTKKPETKSRVSIHQNKTNKHENSNVLYLSLT